jgi:hypothetical protein
MLTVAPATMSTFAVIVFELSHVSVLTGFPLDEPPLEEVDPPLDDVDPPLLLVEPPLELPELELLEEEPPPLEVLPPLLEPPAAGGPPPAGPWVSSPEQPMAIAAKTAVARVRRVFMGSPREWVDSALGRGVAHAGPSREVPHRRKTIALLVGVRENPGAPGSGAYQCRRMRT